MNNQFQIPDSLSDGPLAEALSTADSLFYTPEIQPEAFQYIKDIEARITDYRARAVAYENGRKSFLKAATSVARPFVPSPKPYIDKLVEKEAEIGGKLLKRPAGIVRQDFWYHDSGDWFYMSLDAQQKMTVIRYQTTASSIHKLVDGRDAPFSSGEAETFYMLPKLYEQKILENQYGQASHYDLAA